ncbi:sugar phosphate isomerase/epimerase family protein [Clostridium oryzae]|uniref:Xylose isomerase-like TIM barrel n=1 Tax=Clostridium oryzae TaxID=1450648 RepID=A0A1V4IIP7_9CLOT|nr:sugar phosphate isomerase/epimerase family protein [Clostridium oryzae]OPJ59789.1 xylose isomerase-like TIM barrel [Clostridium oryzae]
MARFKISAFADEIDEKLEVQLRVLKENNIKYMEVRGVDGESVVNYTLEEVSEIKKRLDAEGISVSAIGSPIGKIGIDEAFEPHLKLFKHTLEIAKILECKYIRMFSFYIPKGQIAEKCRQAVMNRWSLFVDAATKHDVVLLHENEKGIYGDTAERCKDILETMNCNFVKATFDPANFVQCDQKVFPEAYELLKNHLEYIHIKDALFSDHSVVPSGYGDGNIKSFLKEVNNINYEGFLSIEPHLGNFKGFAELENKMNLNMNVSHEGEKNFLLAKNALYKILEEIGVEAYE